MNDHGRRRFEIIRSQKVSCAEQCVMDRVLDSTTWPEWQPEILSTEGSERVTPGEVVRGRARMLGFEVQGHSTAIAVGQDRFEEDVIVGVRLRVHYETRRAGSSTIITHRLVSELPSGLFGRLLALGLRWRLRVMQRGALAALAHQSEDSCS